MTEPLLGHLDPDFLRIMDSCREKLRAVLRTENTVTLATPGTGTSGMEAAVMNAVQPGDEVVVGVCGYFGGRIAEMAERAGGRGTRVEAPWGSPVGPEAMRTAILRGGARVVAVVHAETSTGVLQPVEPIVAAAREAGALTIVDCVTSLGGVPVETDRWGADVVYSATQKCLSAPPGAAPITVSKEAWSRISAREVPPNSWYLDLRLLEAYWDERRVYHHTAPISMVYALHEALSLVLEEGLEARWARHERNGRALQAGLEAMGLQLHAEAGHRLPVLTTVKVPEGIDEAAIRRGLLERYSIEVGGGLGELRGKVWRVGLMGEASTPGNVLYFLSAFGRLLREAGFRADIRAGREAAAAVLGG